MRAEGASRAKDNFGTWWSHHRCFWTMTTGRQTLPDSNTRALGTVSPLGCVGAKRLLWSLPNVGSNSYLSLWQPFQEALVSPTVCYTQFCYTTLQPHWQWSILPVSALSLIPWRKKILPPRVHREMSLQLDFRAALLVCLVLPGHWGSHKDVCRLTVWWTRTIAFSIF